MKNIVFGIFLLIGFLSYGQINYEKGYFITDTGKRTDAYIRNSNSIQRSAEINYKLTENGKNQSIGVDRVKEVGIGDDTKFISSVIKVNKFSSNQRDLDQNQDPDYTEKLAFLQVLVDGASSLYLYKSNEEHFYYNTIENRDLIPLIYKKYLTEESKIEENNTYRKQLYENFKCSFENSPVFQNLDYKRKDLVDFFAEFNECKGSSYRDLSKRDADFDINLTIRPGLNFSTFQLVFGNREGNSREYSQVSDVLVRLGVETEFILPLNRNKWSFTIEPTFQKFSYQEERYDQEVIVDFSSVEIPFGIRHYMFLNDNSQVFLNAAFVPIFNIKSEIYFQFNDDIGLSDKPYFLGGIGFKYKNKYSAEFRIGSKRDIIEDRQTSWYSDFQSFSFIIGYTIF